MASVTMTTIGLAVIGTVATAVETRLTSNTASSASARTAKRPNLRTAKANKSAANCPISRKTKTATTKTIIVVVIGMEVTAAPSQTAARSISSIAR